MEIQIPKITDEMFMEHCLNLKASGYDPMLFIAFFAMGRKWHIDKFTFLMKELKNCVSCTTGSVSAQK